MLIWSAGRFVPSGDASRRVSTDGLGADVPLLAKLKGDLDVVGRAAGQRNVRQAVAIEVGNNDPRRSSAAIRRDCCGVLLGGNAL